MSTLYMVAKTGDAGRVTDLFSGWRVSVGSGQCQPRWTAVEDEGPFAFIGNVFATTNLPAAEEEMHAIVDGGFAKTVRVLCLKGGF